MSPRTLQISIAVVVALGVAALFFIFGGFGSIQSTTPAPVAEQVTLQDEVLGTGEVAELGDLVAVNYTGQFTNGTVFDTSVGKNPFVFMLGAGQVIPGWDQGVQGMRVGGKRLLVVPPSLAYGAQDYGPIPGNSTLVFEIELLGIASSTNAAVPAGSVAE